MPSARANETGAFRFWLSIAGFCLTFVSVISLYREITRHSLGLFVDRLARHYAEVLETLFLPVSRLIPLEDVERIALSIVAIFVTAFVRTFQTLRREDSETGQWFAFMVNGVAGFTLLTGVATLLFYGTRTSLAEFVMAFVILGTAYVIIVMIGCIFLSVFSRDGVIPAMRRRIRELSILLLNIGAALAAILVALMLDA